MKGDRKNKRKKSPPVKVRKYKEEPKAKDWLPFCDYPRCTESVFPCPHCLKPAHHTWWVNLNDIHRPPTTKLFMMNHAHFLKDHDKWRNYEHVVPPALRAKPGEIKVSYVMNAPRYLPAVVQRQFNRAISHRRYNDVRAQMVKKFDLYNRKLDARRNKLDREKAKRKAARDKKRKGKKRKK